MHGLLALWPLLLSALSTAGLAAFVAPRRARVPGGTAYLVVLLAETWWSVGLVLELLAPTASGKLLFESLQVPAPGILAVATLAFAARYTDRLPVRPLRASIALAGPPALAAAALTVGPRLGLFRQSARIVPAGPFGSLVYDFTLLDWLYYLWCLLAGVAAVALLGSAMARRPRVFRLQGGVLVAGIAGPTVGSLLAIALGVRWLGQRDVTPLLFGVSSLAAAWALFRARMFDLVPIAREAILERMADGVLVLDARGRVADVNPRASAALAIGPDAVGRAAESIPAWTALATAMGEAEARGEAELTLGDAVHAVAVSGLGEPGRAAGRVVLLRDVTAERRAAAAVREARDLLEQRVRERTAELTSANAALRAEIAERARAETALRESEERFRAVFENTFQLTGLLSPDGRLLIANRTALELAGVSASEVVGRCFWETPWWSHDAAVASELRHAIERAACGEFVRYETFNRAADGTLRAVDFSMKPIRGEDGKVLMLIPEGRDVTELRAAEAERAELRERLVQAQKMESIGRLAGGVAHDFNNLLASILGNTEEVRSLVGPGEASEALDDVIHAARSAASLTAQLLAFSRKARVEPKVLDPWAVVERSTRMLSRLLGPDVRLVTVAPREPVRILVDPFQLEQVLVNLAVNARDAMARGGVLTVEVTRERWDEAAARRRSTGAGDWVRISVADDGCGMPEEVRTRIFEPFFTTKGEGKGTGLGLAMVYGAVTQSGGAIEVDSAPGRGSRFDLFFPLQRERVAAPAPARKAPRGSGERIVVVEDQDRIRELLRRLLARLGYDVVAYSDPLEARAALEAEGSKVDLLLTDVRMPGLSGPELARAACARRPGLGVIFMSGLPGDAGPGAAATPGFAFLAKPFTREALAEAVRAALRSRTALP